MENSQNKFMVTARVEKLLVTDAFASCILKVKRIKHLHPVMVKNRGNGLRKEKFVTERFLFPKRMTYRVYNSKEDVCRMSSYHHLTCLQQGKTYKLEFEFVQCNNGHDEFLLLHEVKDVPLSLDVKLDVLRNWRQFLATPTFFRPSFLR